MIHNTLSFLFDLQKFGMKLGLENIKSLLHSIDNPHLRFPSIHIAGTNGKGSTASLIASICTTAGYKTGLYTSPHLVTFNERIRIDGIPISDERIIRYTDILHDRIVELQATFFEAATTIAFSFFADEKVDIAIIEAGLGGRLDSTNIITPILSIITNISLEHTEHLGSTIESIASEKAGIIKPQIPVITGVENENALIVIRQKATELNSQLITLNYQVSDISISNFDFMKFCYHRNHHSQEYTCGLIGEHQIKNSALAIEAAHQLEKYGWRITDESIAEGLANVRKLSGLRARLESIQTSPEIVIDVAHNPDGFEKMLKSFSRIRSTHKTNFVFGLLATKDYMEVIRQILLYDWKNIVIVEPKSEEARNANDVQSIFEQRGVKTRMYRSVKEGIAAVIESMHVDETTLLCGSHYVVGDYLC